MRRRERRRKRAKGRTWRALDDNVDGVDEGGIQGLGRRSGGEGCGESNATVTDRRGSCQKHTPKRKTYWGGASIYSENQQSVPLFRRV